MIMQPLDTVLCPVRDRPVWYELLFTACLYFAECHGDEADTIDGGAEERIGTFQVTRRRFAKTTSGLSS